VPDWVVIVGIVGIVGIAWATTSLSTGSGVESRGHSMRVRPLFSARFYRATPAPAEIESAFAAEGLALRPAGSEIDASRFAPLRPHIVAAYRMAGPSLILVVLFDRPEPRAPMKLGVGGVMGGRNNGEAAGRVYVEYRSTTLDGATAAAVRRAFRRLQ
jgi:hypothetical protein